MVNVGGDAQDVLLKQGVQLATVGLATTNVELIIEACGIGPQGPPGVSGNVIHSGDGPPDPELGRVGDYYIDWTGHDLYGPKRAGSGGALPISHVETYQSANVAGAVAALSDDSDATSVRISSAEDADWFLHLDGSLVGTEAFQVELHFNVLSHGARPFTFRSTLASAEPPDTLTSVELVQGRPVIAGADPGGAVVGTDPLHDGSDATYARSTITIGTGQVAWVTTQVPAIPDLTLANFQSLDTYVRIKPAAASGATFPMRFALGFQTESFGFISEFDDPGTALSGALALPNNTAAGAVIGHTSLKGNSGTYTDGVSDLIPKLVSGDCQIVFYVLTNPGDPNGAKYTADLLEMSMTLVYGDPPPDTGSAEVDFRGTLANGFNEYVLNVDQSWMNTHPLNPGNPDQASAWTDGAVYGVPEDYANVVALLGSDAVLHIRGYDGNPYEVDLVYAAILAGGSAWGTPVPLDQGQPGPPGPPGADGLDGDDGTDGSVVLYEQPNDPGAVDEGSMWIDTDSTVVPYVDEVEGGSGGDYENVRDYGAVGDGVHDDGPAIQAAIDAAVVSKRPVYFPSGTYLISQQLNLYTGTTLEGVGRTSIIKLVDGYTENIDMVTTAMGDGTRDVTIRRLCVDGNKDNISSEAEWTIDTAPWTTCLHLLDVTNLVLEDLLIINSTIEGVYLGQVHYGSVSRVEASGNGFWRKDASGIHLDGSSHMVVSDCVTNSNGFHGIIFSAATDNVVTNHYSADNGFDGTRLQWSADRNRFEKFIAERNSRGIYVMHYSTLNHFTHCTLRNSLWNGFFSNNCNGNDLTFTHIEGSGEYAVGSVEAGDNQRGYGNTYRNNALGDYSLAAGSTFSTIAGAGEAI